MTPDDFDHECFLISPIGTDGSEVRRQADNVRDYIVRPAARSHGLRVVRADALRSPGQITVQVAVHVLRARAVVADLTGRNANVYYELAIRHTAELPAVLIAHKREGGRLPFDIQGMRVVFYEDEDPSSAAEAQDEITENLAHAISPDNSKVYSPLSTAINATILDKGDAFEQGLAEVLIRVDSMHTLVAELARNREPVRAVSGLGFALGRDPRTPAPAPHPFEPTMRSDAEPMMQSPSEDPRPPDLTEPPRGDADIGSSRLR